MSEIPDTMTMVMFSEPKIGVTLNQDRGGEMVTNALELSVDSFFPV